MIKIKKTDLFDYADNEGIGIIYTALPTNLSVSMMSASGSCYIGIDSKQSMTEAEQKTHLAHEIGHCETGAFYNPYSSFNVRNKLENKANKWAIKKLIPEDELNTAVENGYTEIWELAEYFDVTEDFMRKAVSLYKFGNLHSV